MVFYNAFRWMLRYLLGVDDARMDERRLARSELFDAGWYQATQVPTLSRAHAARHYLRQGAALGLSPSPRFDGPRYLANNPDVAVAGLNPLLHYINSGRAEGRSICPVARPEALARIAAQICSTRTGIGNPGFRCSTGPSRAALPAGGRRVRPEPGPLFDGPWYLANNPDVAAADQNPLLHYLNDGRLEGGRSARSSTRRRWRRSKL